MIKRIACAFLLSAIASMALANEALANEAPANEAHANEALANKRVKVAAAAESSRAAPATPKLAGVLVQNPIWKSYRSRFVTESGRVVDTANAQISHSEGQGYGMLLAVAAMDRDAFERIWGWTRANLMVRDDQLVAWAWDPATRPGVADLNNATDGDILIAWALVEAAEAWKDRAYAVAARRIAVEVGRKLIILQSDEGMLLLPGASGYSAEDRSDGPVVNLSYYIFPAFQRLHLAAPEFNWAKLSQDGLKLINRARFGKVALPVEWTALRGGQPAAAAGFPAVFGYNAIRIPLYMIWAGIVGENVIGTLVGASGVDGSRPLSVVDVASGRPVEALSSPGYSAISALHDCAVNGKRWPAALNDIAPSEHYYPATLQLLALSASISRWNSCGRG
ncbi:MAG TPA: glycosyl hydrolase family 8 [Xanthobacteraceae bacterium]|jgi:endoglucanase|nr:glycosyl hydrolase family 8 [Xanthobacteraceae bacterium]